jgi:uracil phosphoribosyltransferase
MIHNLSQHNSIIGNYIAELRDENIQKDPMRFRLNLSRLASLMGYEVSKKLHITSKNVTTPLGQAEVNIVEEMPVLATILRAGLAMHEGLLHVFDRSESAFVSAYRKHSSAEEFSIRVEYQAAPNLTNRTIIISDPMLATGASMVSVYKSLLLNGNPLKIYILAAVASKDALDYVRLHLPQNTEFFVGAIDEELTAHSYIVPGLGDAGDLAYGSKL